MMLLKICKITALACLPTLLVAGFLGTRKEAFMVVFETAFVLLAASVIVYLLLTEFFL